MKPLSVLFALSLSASALMAESPKGFYLKDGDRVVFYGDSITEQRLYTTLAESYIVTRFPKLDVHFVHSGWGGDRVTGGGGGPIDLRLDRDVIAYKPTVMTIMLGMNDGSYRAFDEKIYQNYTNGFEHIISKVKGALPDLRITLIQPSPYDDFAHAPKFEGGYNKVLMRYSDYLGDVGKREKMTVADLNTPVVEALKKAKEMDAPLAARLIPDQIHPGAAGHLLMAEALLKAWGAPALVSRVEIDAASHRVVTAENAKANSVKNNGTITWNEKEESLPMPLELTNNTFQLALKASDFVQTMDQEILKVTGLTAGHYKLQIDNMDVGSFSKQELENGINLATVNTPMLKQANDVHALTILHNDIHSARWRNFQVQAKYASVDPKTLNAAMAGMDQSDVAVARAQHEKAQPVPHSFTLTPEN